MSHITEKIRWIKNRIRFRYRESSDSRISTIIDDIGTKITAIKNLTINQKEIDNIISKYYFGFDVNCEKDNTNDFSYGYSEQERIDTRNKIINISRDIIDHILCENTIQDNKSNKDPLLFSFDHQYHE